MDDRSPDDAVIECRICDDWFVYEGDLDPAHEYQIIVELGDNICPDCIAKEN